jgi:hypothetical protein
LLNSSGLFVNTSYADLLNSPVKSLRERDLAPKLILNCPSGDARTIKPAEVLPMSQQWSRRSFVSLASALGVVSLGRIESISAAQSAPTGAVLETFPAQDPMVTKEVVTVSHSDLRRVRELVERQPALARASIDWGFGDWEACIDAAAHVGRREIAEFLVANGARPTIFSAAMMGQLDVVKAFVAARPGVQRNYGPHGITLMAHARAGGPDAVPVVQFLTALGDAEIPLTTVPLAAEDRDGLVGRYVFGAGPRDHFTIDVQNDRLGIERVGGPARRFLLHIGDLVFFPTGVPSAKIAFARVGGKVTHLTLADPAVLVTAKRD